MVKWMFRALPETDRSGLLSERADGSDMNLATSALGATTRAYAVALGVDPSEINDKWVDAPCNLVAHW